MQSLWASSFAKRLMARLNRQIILTLMALMLVVVSFNFQTSETLADNARNKANSNGQATGLVVVTVSPEADPTLLAAQYGYENLGAVDSAAGEYLFRAVGGITTLDASTAQNQAITLAALPNVLSAQAQFGQSRANRAVVTNLTDPMVKAQWHLNNTGQYRAIPGNDARIFGAWNAGYTGNGVVVASVDDGVFTAHPDLAPNYDPTGSHDFVDYHADPTPSGSYSHGTSVAGVMAAAADGATCGVGVAFNAAISGLRLPLNISQTDAQEAMALTYGLQHNDIYNNSWGPLDTGKGSDMQAPGPLTQEAFQRGVIEGRGGLGAIYVWAAGNGRDNHDNVNADGYASSIYTIAVAATDNAGRAAWYSEPGASILVNAPSSGPAGGGIRTTASGAEGCTEAFGGTSAASPLVSGVVGLMLEANPNLTWRDVQHILVNSAQHNDPENPEWIQNGAGYWVNHDYGFGRVNAETAVNLAKTWTTVNPQFSLKSKKVTVNTAVPSAAPLTSAITVNDDFAVEHVEVILNATHPARGQLEITLISPSGTVSKLMSNRRKDKSANYQNWKFMSVRNWGERSNGTWTLRVTDREADDKNGSLNDWKLIVHGSKPPVSGEILKNTSFEKARKDGFPQNWTMQGKRAAADRVRLDNTPSRSIAFEGNRSLQLRGTKHKNLTLAQNPSVHGLTTGDSLNLSAMVKADQLSNGLRLVLIVDYAHTSLADDKLIIPLAAGTYDYTFVSNRLRLAGAVKALHVSIEFKTPTGSGRALLDNVSLVVAKNTAVVQPLNGEGLIPVPAVSTPTELRGGN